eukprot:SAG11_NODE_5534_length_1533_cov_1.003487_1_plen_53_part_00
MNVTMRNDTHDILVTTNLDPVLQGDRVCTVIYRDLMGGRSHIYSEWMTMIGV